MDKGNKNVKSNQDMYSNINSHWTNYYPSSSSYRGDSYDDDFATFSNKRKHSFTPILLVISTVYNCDHCGAKKEECTTDYCEEKKIDKNHNYDIGDWG